MSEPPEKAPLDEWPSSHGPGMARPNAGVVTFELERLLQGAREAIIIHNGENYRLRITSKGKLILTK